MALPRLADFVRAAGLELEDRVAGLALARDAGLLAARAVVARERALVVLAREPDALAREPDALARELVDFAPRVVVRARDALRRAAGAAPISATGTSSWTTSAAS